MPRCKLILPCRLFECKLKRPAFIAANPSTSSCAVFHSRVLPRCPEETSAATGKVYTAIARPDSWFPGGRVFQPGYVLSVAQWGLNERRILEGSKTDVSDEHFLRIWKADARNAER